MRRFLLIFVLVLLHGIYVSGQINLDYWMDMGRDKLMKKQFLPAIEDFNTIIRFKPDLDDAYYFRAIAKYYMDDYRGAIDDFSTAIRIHPYSSNLYTYYFLYRGVSREKLMDFRGAIDDYTSAIEVNPGNYEAYLNRGFMYNVLKEFDKALEDFNTVILYDLKNPMAYLYRAFAYNGKGNLKASDADFTRAIRLDPKFPESYLRRGGTRMQIKDFRGAIKDFDNVIRLDSLNTLAYFNRALAEMETQELNAAMKDLNQVIRLDPSNDIAFYDRAILKVKTGDYKGAVEDYTRVLKINPTHVLSWFSRANIYQQLNNPRKAIEDYTAAIKLYPDFANAYYNRSIAKRNMKDMAGAERDFQIAVRLNAGYQQLRNSNKLDSTGLAKLEDFKATFSPDNRATEPSQNMEPFQNFTISYGLGNQSTDNMQDELAELNRTKILKGSFVLTSDETPMQQEKAQKLYDSISLSTNDSNAKSFLLAILKKNLQDYNGSIEYYSKIITQKPEFSKAYFNRANTRFEALSLLNTFREHSSRITIDQNSQAPQVKQITTVNYEQVIDDYNKSIELDPSFSYGYFNLANVKTLQKDFTTAIINYTKAILKKPGFGEAYYNRGLLYLYMHQNETGCDDLSKAGQAGISKAYQAIKIFCNK